MSATNVLPSPGLSLPERVASQSQRKPWIISQKDDLTWFIGSGLVSYATLACLMLGAPVLPFQLFWLFCVDGPHVLSTVTRTYCDRAERAKLGGFLWIPLPLMLIGPAMTLAGYFSLFMLLAVCWQHFHIVKQHFGFMMIYKAKVGDRGARDFWLDRYFLLASLFVPLGIFVLRTRFALTGFLAWLPGIAIAMYAVLAAAWLLRQAQKKRAGEQMNWPKLGLLATVVPLQWLALLHASNFGPDGIIRAGITLGMFHSFQYHRLMWFHNKNRYRTPGAQERNGLAARLVPNVAFYAGLVIALHFLLSFLPQALAGNHPLMVSAIWGIAFTHYLFDARIWHIRSDKELAVALKMA